MDYKIFFYSLMLITFISYVLFIWIKYGIQKSISASYYVLPEKYNFLFTLFCWGFAFPAIILGVEVSSLMFFAGAGICLVGAAPQILKKDVDKIHTFAAISGIIFSQLAIFFGFHLWYINVISIVAMVAISLLVKKYNIWWTEIVAFSAIGYAITKAVFQI